MKEKITSGEWSWNRRRTVPSLWTILQQCLKRTFLPKRIMISRKIKEYIYEIISLLLKQIFLQTPSSSCSLKSEAIINNIVWRQVFHRTSLHPSSLKYKKHWIFQKRNLVKVHSWIKSKKSFNQSVSSV